MFDLDALMSNGLVLIPLVTGLTQLIKSTMLSEKNFKYSPYIAIGLAILLSFLFNNQHDITIQQQLAQGLVVGLGSVGLYSAGKNSIKDGEKTID
jgi:hypothetical protein